MASTLARGEAAIMEASSLGPGVRSRSLKLEVVPEEEAGVVEVNRESKLKKVSEWLYRR